METFIKIIGAVVLVAFLWWFFFFIGWFYGYSEGERTVEVYKFSYKGLIWKSFEGEAYVGGVETTGGENPTLQLEKFYFSVAGKDEETKSEILVALKNCAQTRKNCTIQYKQWFKSPIYIGSAYEVIGVIQN